MKQPGSFQLWNMIRTQLFKMLTVLVSTIFNSQVFLLKKNVSSFCICKSYSHFFSKNISVFSIFYDQSFNDTLTNNIFSFELLGPAYDCTVLIALFCFSVLEISERG